MSVVVRCLCGQQFSAAPHLFGQRVPCPSCASPIQIPQGPAPAPTAAPAPMGVNPQVTRPQPAPAPTQPAAARTPPTSQSLPAPRPLRKTKSNSGGGAIALAIVGVVLLLVVGGVGAAGYAIYRGVRSAMGIGAPSLDADFAEARQQHRTQLTSREKAPQEWNPLRTPAGATAIRYSSSAGSLQAYVDPPPADGKKRPAVVFLHGGFAYGESDWRMAQPYRDAGYIVMTPVLRAENGQSGHFTLYFDEVDDVLAATDTLAQLPYVDNQKIFIAGHSAGGTLTTLAALASDRYRGAAALSGCMDQRLNADIAPFDADEDEYNIRSPLAYAKSFKCPTRLFFGSQEMLLASGNRATASRAAAAGLDVEAISVPGDHFSSVDEAIERSIGFFRQLGGSTSSPTARPEALAGAPTPSIPNPALPSPNIPTPNIPDFPTPNIPTPNIPSIPTPNIPTPDIPNLGPNFGRPRLPDIAPPNIPTPNIPNIPTPTMPQPNIPEIPRLPTPGSSFGGRRGNLGPSKAVVTFQVQSYNGRLPESSAARRALIGVRWVNIAQIRYDRAKQRVVVGVRGNSVNTAEAKQKLESNGFSIGSTTYHGSGLSD